MGKIEIETWTFLVLEGQSVEVFTELIPLPLGRDLMEIQRRHFGKFASGTAKTPETMPERSAKREMGSMQHAGL